MNDERDTTTAGFAVGDRVGRAGPHWGTPCFGKVTWVGGCDQRDTPSCYRICKNVEVEWYCHGDPGKRLCPAGDLEHLD
ncbi:MAG: hypothetical protein QOD58_3602 [Mycobacterium sp.]|nr:hypothetical protein [Mycobacterium sp.]